MFALCYLAADARVFGADTTAWDEVYADTDVSAEDEEWLHSLGVLRLRQRLLAFRILREHLSCYFCMGVWAGPAAHLLLWYFYGSFAYNSEYFLLHESTVGGWVVGLVCAFLLGAPASYLVNSLLRRIENY